jgi:hypothetical protein
MKNRNLFLLGLLLLSVMFLCSCVVNPGELVGQAITVATGITGILAFAAPFLLPGEAAPIEALLPKINLALAAAKAAASSYHGSPSDDKLQVAVNALTDAHDNINQLEAAAQIKDPVTQAKIQGAVDGMRAILSGVEANLHANHAGAVAQASQ